MVAKTAFWRVVKAANPTLPDKQISYMIDRAIKQCLDPTASQQHGIDDP